ncbi:hypothetical protein GCM10009836_52390 [Pseudonocardia ailaonensis]|uniref:Resolvase/invertase-type recombinase catalytic domain-containing protein n=1 Tax=Pseudonocardia ailaonensis TaxID=367279 RepID=A0ABN2NEH7_9PSEU
MAELRRFLEHAEEAGVPDSAVVYVRTKDFGSRQRLGKPINHISVDTGGRTGTG